MANYFKTIYDFTETSKNIVNEITNYYQKLINDIQDSKNYLKLKKTIGPDDIPTRLGKLHGKELCLVMMFYFNLSLKNFIYPLH